LKIIRITLVVLLLILLWIVLTDLDVQQFIGNSVDILSIVIFVLILLLVL